MKIRGCTLFTTEGEVTLVAPNNLLRIQRLQGDQTCETSRLGVLTGTEGCGLLGDDQLGGEDVPGGHHVPAQTRAELDPERKTRVLIHVLAVAVVGANIHFTFVTLTTCVTTTQKTLSSHSFKHCFITQKK